MATYRIWSKMYSIPYKVEIQFPQNDLPIKLGVSIWTEFIHLFLLHNDFINHLFLWSTSAHVYASDTHRRAHARIPYHACVFWCLNEAETYTRIIKWISWNDHDIGNASNNFNCANEMNTKMKSTSAKQNDMRKHQNHRTSNEMMLFFNHHRSCSAPIQHLLYGKSICAASLTKFRYFLKQICSRMPWMAFVCEMFGVKRKSLPR